MLIIRRSNLYYTASGIITPVGGHSVYGQQNIKIWIIKVCEIIVVYNNMNCISRFEKL